MKQKQRSKLFVVQVVVLLIMLTLYLLARTFSLYHSRVNIFEQVFAVLFFFAEAFLMVHSFAFFLNILRDQKPVTEPPQKEPGEDASVAIAIPARHEPKHIVADTLLTCINLEYPNKRIYLLDDSSIEQYKQEARELAEEYGVELFTRPNNRGAKAGLINDFMATMKEKYIAVFDADQNPMSQFLDKVLPFLEGDERLAFVQTPQFYTNTEVSPVALVANAQQAVFFEYVCEAKSSHDSMFCCGTNVVIRRSALEDVGGFEEDTVTEDFATSLKLHRNHWKSLYYNKAFTFGMAPEDLGSYFKQQSRWAMGSFQLFRKLLLLFITNIKAIRPIQWFEYALSSSYYFIGWADLFLMAGPIIYIFFNIPSFFMSPEVYLLIFVPYFLLSFMVYYSSMREKNYSARNIFKVQMLSMMTMPVYVWASLQVLFNRKKGFQITSKEGGRSVPLRTLAIQLSLFVVHLFALSWGAVRFYHEPTAAIALNMVWVALHALMFGSIFYFNRK